jgi:hypothetical protein
MVSIKAFIWLLIEAGVLSAGNAVVTFWLAAPFALLTMANRAPCDAG